TLPLLLDGRRAAAEATLVAALLPPDAGPLAQSRQRRRLGAPPCGRPWCRPHGTTSPHDAVCTIRASRQTCPRATTRSPQRSPPTSAHPRPNKGDHKGAPLEHDAIKQNCIVLSSH